MYFEFDNIAHALILLDYYSPIHFERDLERTYNGLGTIPVCVCLVTDTTMLPLPFVEFHNNMFYA